MHKSVLAIAAAGSLFTVTAAGASGLNVADWGGAVKVVNTNDTTVSTYNCVDALSLAWHFTDSSHQLIDKVTVSGATTNSTCLGQTVTVRLFSSKTFVTEDFTGTFPASGSATTDVSFVVADPPAPGWDVVTNPISHVYLTVSKA